MKQYACVCGNCLFFDNSACVKCKRDVGWCPACKGIVALEPAAAGGFVCMNSKCGHALLKCENYFTHNVCNRCVVAPDLKTETAGTRTAPADGPTPVSPLCDYCRFNRTVPDLGVTENKSKWGRIEHAKRRALYDFDYLELPYGSEADGVKPPLWFDFKADAVSSSNKYRDVAGAGEQVFTGHDNGVVTINLKEADPVAREHARVQFGEAHRTLVGHFRHEMGHYVWDVAIKGQREAESIELFGDHNLPYNEALNAYYVNGPKPGWAAAYVSGYATMHPWEDWAETVANYLDMMATLETAEEGKLVPKLDRRNLDSLCTAYANLGLTLNELNRGIGLVDFLPEILVGPVRKKMGMVHSLTKWGK